MIGRTPPLKKRRGPEEHESPLPPGPLVIYEDHPSPSPSRQLQLQPSSSAAAEGSSHHMLCTYQCRQMVKSDFIDALSTAEKQVHEYQSKLEALNETLCKTETERRKFLDQFLYTEQELAAAKGREESLQKQLLKEARDSQERLSKQLQTYTELEVKLQNEIDLRRKAETSVTSAEEKASLLEGKLSHLSESIEREKKHLNNDLAHLKRESKLSIARITADLERMECRAHNSEKESELLQGQLDDLKKQLHECLQQKSEAENKLFSFTFQEVNHTDDNILVKLLQEELRNYEAEVRAARKLKSSHEDAELLKEKLLEEKGRRERAESELSKLQEFHLSMKKLEDELTSWKLMTKDIPGVSCCDDVPVKFGALQKEVIDSMKKEGEATARWKQLEVALDAALIGKRNAETEAKLITERVEVSKSEINRIELMLSRVTEERDKLKNDMDVLKRGKSHDGGGEAASQPLLQELESSLAKKECYIKEIESALHKQKEVNSCQHEEIQLLNDRLKTDARKVKSLEREADQLRSEISLLESKMGHGDFSAANTKVLRMVNTLSVDNETKQTIEFLRTELQKTKEKLQAVEELKSQSGEAGKLVDSHISGKIVQLKEQIATLEKREERYKTVFADRISVFRRACCELFGYKIVMDEHQRPNGIPVTRFTLQSIYGQSDTEKLEFEYESGTTNIMANDYTSQRDISQQVEIFIRKMNSIPAFTANLTMESFNRRTLT